MLNLVWHLSIKNLGGKMDEKFKLLKTKLLYIWHFFKYHRSNLDILFIIKFLLIIHKI